MGFKRKIAELLDFPQTSLGCSYVEIISDGAVIINGCTEIIDYSDSRAVFATREFILTVEGSGLEICSYGGENAYLKGRIASVGIRREK